MKYYLELFEKAKNTNRVMVESNSNTMRDSSFLSKGLSNIRDSVVDLVVTYKKNEFDLLKVKNECVSLEENWVAFINVLSKNSTKKLLSNSDREELGNSLNNVYFEVRSLCEKLSEIVSVEE